MIYSLGVLLSQFGISLCSTSGSNCCFLAFSVEFMVWGKNTKVMYQSSSWWGVRSLHFLCDFRKVCACVHGAAVQPFVTPWTVACQAPLSMEFSKQEYWDVLPCPPPGDLTDPGIELEPPVSPIFQFSSVQFSCSVTSDSATPWTRKSLFTYICTLFIKMKIWLRRITEYVLLTFIS